MEEPSPNIVHTTTASGETRTIPFPVQVGDEGKIVLRGGGADITLRIELVGGTQISVPLAPNAIVTLKRGLDLIQPDITFQFSEPEHAGLKLVHGASKPAGASDAG